MQMELEVSLLRGRTILDHRALRSGAALRLPVRSASVLELLESEPSPTDVVVDFRDGTARLVLPEGVVGELGQADGGTREDAGSLVLPRDGRGRVVLGNETLLLRCTPPRVAVPRRHLPPEVRRWIARAERPLLIVLGATLVLELLFLNAVRLRREIPLDAPDEEPFVSHALPRITPPALPKPPEQSPKPEPSPRPSHAATPHPSETPTPTDKPSEIAEQVQRSAMLKAIAALRKNPVFQTGGSSPFEDIFNGLQPRAMLDVTTAGMGPHRSAEIDAPVGIGSLTTGPYVRRELVEHLAYKPVITIPAPEPEPDQDPDDVRAVSRQIRARKGEIQRCYESSLKRNPGLAGRMVIEFTIAQSGAIQGVEFPAEQLEGESVQTCISERARGWRLAPLRQNDSMVVSFPFLFASAP